MRALSRLWDVTLADEATFTVLIAVYGRDDPSLFDAALRSIFSNTLQPSKCVLVVDGPVGCPLKTIISSYQEVFPELIKVCWLPVNKGLAKALNIGLQLVETEFVARADADDINAFNRFETQYPFTGEGFDLFGSAIEEVDRLGNRLSIKTPPLSQEDIRRYLKKRNPFNHMTVFFRTALAIECGGYPELDLREDYGLWAKMIMRGARCMNLDMPLVKATTGEEFYRRRGGIRSVKAEVAMQNFLVGLGIKGRFEALVEVVLKGSIFIAPSFIRAFIYRTFLRRGQR